MKNHPLRGSLMVLAAALLWGTTGTAQSLAPPHLSAYWIGALRLACVIVAEVGAKKSTKM